MPTDGPVPADPLRTVAHDLGNLAYRLSLLSANLSAQIADPGHRGEAVALLQDTADRLRKAADRLRELTRDG